MRGELLKGQVAIVTGGTRGIGRSIVLAIAKEGADCVFTYTSSQSLAESLVEEVQTVGRCALPVRVDVRDFEGTKALVERVKSEFGRIDLLVNNAGITRDRSLLMMAREDWSDVIDTDLTGVYNTTRACISLFLRQRSGSIVNISSVSGIHPLAGQTNYAAAKAGVIGFTKSLAKEVGPYSIRVNVVAPGFVDTDMTAKLGEKYRQKLLQIIPSKRFGKPEEVAKVVVFLLSNESQYITGQVIVVDGGLSLLSEI
jgi:3-oxoacyl-[acyl-carrier protein] reductase